MRAKFFTTVFVLFFGKAICQPYSFSSSSVTYASLTGTTSVNGSTVWSYATSFSVPIGFTFNFMGNNYTTIFVEGGGFTYFDAGYNYIILPFGVALEDKGTASSLSPITYKLEGSSPNQILKIEWSNADYYNNPGSTANFQLWLYETTNVIETHVGSIINPSLAYSWNSDDGPSIGIYEFSGPSCLYGFGLTGSTIFPTENNNLSGTGINVFGYSLNGTPSGNTVYTFTPNTTSTWENDDEVSNFNVYYNKLTGKIIYDCSYERIEQLSVYDIYGKHISTFQSGKYSDEIYLKDQLDITGIYIIKATLSNKDLISKKLFLSN
jgi:hypothetical protein